MRTEEFVDPGEAVSGVITISTAGTAQQGTAGVVSNNGFYLKGLAGNTGVVYVGGDGAGDVAAANGFELSQDQLIHVTVANLSDLWFDAATNGDKICWIKS